MNRSIKFYLVIALLSLLSSTTSARAAAPTSPELGTDHLENGQPVRLRGVNMPDLFWARSPVWYPMYSTAYHATLTQTNRGVSSIFPTQRKNMGNVALLVGVIYYIDNTNAACSDVAAGAGLTPVLPYCTISKGASMATAGNTVRVMAGTYAETVTVPNSGSAGNPITFSAAPGVIVTGNGTPTTGSAFRILAKNYIVVDGFTITGTVSYGIQVADSTFITISNNHVSYSGLPSNGNTRSGIILNTTTDSIVSGNNTDHNTSDGIRLSNGSANVTVNNNISFANAEQWQRNATGIQVTGALSHNNTIIHNIAYANEDTGLQFFAGANTNLVLGNLSYGNGDHGIDCSTSPYNTVIGNTVQGNYTSGINFEGATAPAASGATVINNISVDNGINPTSGQKSNIRVDTLSVGGTTLDYNMVFLTGSGTSEIQWNSINYATLAAFKAAVPGQEVHGLQADPLFVSAVPPVVSQPPALVVGDYNLQAGSPAIDAGDDANCTATDQRGVTRPQGSHCDIGAYELEMPQVKNISRIDVSPTVLTSVRFTVTFSRPVTGVDTTAPFNDFALTTTGSISGASITSVSGSGATYTVTVNTGSGAGTIRLDVADNNSIVDAAANPLGGLALGDGNFTIGEAYTKIIITDTWAVKVSPSTNVSQLVLQLGAQNLGQIGSLTGYYLFRIPGSNTQPKAATDLLAANPQVLWFGQQVAQQQSARENPSEGNLVEVNTATATVDDVQSQDNSGNVSATNTPPASTQTAISITESSPVSSQVSMVTQTIAPSTPTQIPIAQIQPSSIPSASVQSAKMAFLPNEPLLVPTTMIRLMIPSTGSENNSSNGGTIVAILITLSLAAGGIIFTLRRVK